MSYLLDVVTDDVADAIAHVGGLMFDLGRAGWRVRVLTDDAAHDRALRILGTCPLAPESSDPAPPAPDRVLRTAALPIRGATPAAPHELYLHWATTEATAAGHPVEFRLSAAAQTFKAQALLCVGRTPDIDGCETLWTDAIPDGGYPFAGCHLSTTVVR